MLKRNGLTGISPNRLRELYNSEEVLIDRYWKLFGPVNSRDEKPRTYREIARRRFLKLIKRRKKSIKKIRKELRKELRYQLGCIRRNLDHFEAYALEDG